MLYDISKNDNNIYYYINFRKKCKKHFITLARNYSIEPRLKFMDGVRPTAINKRAAMFLQIPINLIEDAMNCDFDISIDKLAVRMYLKCNRTKISTYKTLLQQLFELFPEGIIIRKNMNVCCYSQNAVVWSPCKE